MFSVTAGSAISGRSCSNAASLSAPSSAFPIALTTDAFVAQMAAVNDDFVLVRPCRRSNLVASIHVYPRQAILRSAIPPMACLRRGYRRRRGSSKSFSTDFSVSWLETLTLSLRKRRRSKFENVRSLRIDGSHASRQCDLAVLGRLSF